MQTAAISYRVADFLRRHAPFEIMDDAHLLALASRGRVKFHEADEFVCWQGEAHGPHLFVIQQGSVSLWEAGEADERLRDIRGPGDMVGLERFLGRETSQYSARTNGDVVLYALHAEDFEALIGSYREVRRYLASHASVNVEGDSEGQSRSAAVVALKDAMGLGSAACCQEPATIREAAETMTRRGAMAMGVTAEDGGVAGVVTVEGLARWVGGGGADTGAPVAQVVEEQGCVIGESARLSECVLMMAKGSGAVVVTSDGSRRGEIRGVVCGPDLAPVLGEDPVAIVRRIRTAADCDAVRRLHQRARSFLLQQLDSTVSVDWLARYARLIDQSILERALQMAGAEETGTCWCFYGAAGRGEALTPVAPQMAVIAADEPMRVKAQQTGERLRETLMRCGYVARQARADEAIACATLREWEERFGGWIEDPVRNGISMARSYFDLLPVRGATRLWQRLEESVRARLRAEPGFTVVLAHDCQAALPPLTFFRDLVVEVSGEQTGVLRLERSALLPLVDVARVFGVAGGRVLGSSSGERFDMASRLVPERDALFKDAAETLRVALFHQARAGIRQHSEGYDLPGAQLSTQERLVLKSGFRSILRLLEFTAEFGWQGIA